MKYSALHDVADLLPFHLDDSEQVNEAFARWRTDQVSADKRLIDIWTYCYIYRYFLVKFALSGRHSPLAFDRLVANAFADVQGNLLRVRQPECFAGWVSTICKNTFVNHLRTQRTHVALETDLSVLIAEDSVATAARDASVLHRSICVAIDALPAFLRTVARMRLLEQRSYQAIHKATGKPMPTLRAYVNRALEQLRRNTTLQALHEEMRDA